MSLSKFQFVTISIFFTIGITIESSAQIKKEYSHLDNSIEFREFMGHKLAQQDWAAEVGTDALIALGANLKHKKLKGFIVENNETHWTLSYIGKRRFSEGIYYQINVTHQEIVKNSYKDYSDKPIKLTDWQKSIFRATETAMMTNILLCSNNYNPVVLPLSLGDTQYLFTYLLAASNQPDLVILGGHHRFIISQDGNKILQHKAHTKSCLSGEMIDSANSQVVTHLNDPIPNEIHIYISYLYEIPIYVWTPDQSLWQVSEGKITAVDTEKSNSEQQPTSQ